MNNNFKQLFQFRGGVKPQYFKDQSLHSPIHQTPLPTYLAIPLHQNVGGTPRPLVKVGQMVKKGEKIGAADGWVSASVHASTSGMIVEIASHSFPHPSGLPSTCVIIEPDGKDEWIEQATFTWQNKSHKEIFDYLREFGIVGLGGAVFPSHAKLAIPAQHKLEELIINGAECEPFITCDDILMRERAEQIIAGTIILEQILQPQRIIIGIEDNKPNAIVAMRKAVSKLAANFAVVSVPTLYPAGGAKQLIRVLTGKEIPASRRSPEYGVQCFNVATIYAIWQALVVNKPMLSRIVTVSGNVNNPGNWETLIGTPINELVGHAHSKKNTDRMIMGGPMMGFVILDQRSPIIKASNCIIAGSPQLFPPPPPEMPCIRCGECANACPHELQPFEMYWYARAKNFDKVEEYNIEDCIECGCCSYVCPSHIPLVSYFRFALAEIREKRHAQLEAEQAKNRFEFRQFREQREKSEKAERIAKAAERQASKMSQLNNKTVEDIDTTKPSEIIGDNLINDGK